MNKILKRVNEYYSEKIIKNGPTPQGVDWNSIESQELRFEILSDIISKKEKFSVLDFGCGFGSMYEYYKGLNYNEFKYIGFDISEVMISEANKKYQSSENLMWVSKIPENLQVDYVIASGIFNVKQELSDKTWLKYIFNTLDQLNKISSKGFAFNVLTKYSDKEFMKDHLFYADPLILFDYCKKKFSKHVCLKHDYPLYEFTIIIRKDV